MSRLSPLVLLVVVSAVFLAYGNSSWSWVAGPVAALLPWALGRKSREPAAASPARTQVRRDPAPVD